MFCADCKLYDVLEGLGYGDRADHVDNEVHCATTKCCPPPVFLSQMLPQPHNFSVALHVRKPLWLTCFHVGTMSCKKNVQDAAKNILRHSGNS